jgi:hypothetical protein
LKYTANIATTLRKAKKRSEMSETAILFTTTTRRKKISMELCT